MVTIMRILTVVLAVALCAACQTGAEATQRSSSVSYSGGDGTTAESAVVIHAPDSASGVRAEYAWIEANLPGARVESQALIPGKRSYDRFEVVLPSGESRTIYFDISAFFGKR